MFSHMPWPPPVLAKRKNEGPTFLCSVLSKITPTTPSLERGAIVAYFLALSSRWSKLVAFIPVPLERRLRPYPHAPVGLLTLIPNPESNPTLSPEESGILNMKEKTARRFDPTAFLATIGDGRKILAFEKGETIFAQGAADAVSTCRKARSS